jgi:hypothetical protein
MLSGNMPRLCNMRTTRSRSIRTTQTRFFIRGDALAKLDRQDEAAQSYERGLALDPNHPYAFGTSIWAYLSACNWERTEALLPVIEEKVAAAKSIIAPFTLLMLPISPATHLNCARYFVRRQMPQVAPIGR